MRFNTTAVLILISAWGAAGQTAPARTGIFEGHGDIGDVVHKGGVEYDAAARTYTIVGGGENMWFAKDEFHFVWKKVTGDFAITADIAFPASGGNAHRKAVLMARQNLETDSAYVDVAVHGDGLTSLQARDESGAATHEVGINAARPAKARLEKRGEYFYMWLAGAGQELRFSGGSMPVPLKAPFYVGIGVCAHDRNVSERAVFSNVALDEGARKPGARRTLYSTLETVSVTSTDRRVVFVDRDRIESPVWTSDALTFKSKGEMYRVPAQGGAAPERTEAEAPPDRPGISDGQLPADEFTNCFPHASPDGRQIALISYAKGTSGCPADQEVMLRVVSVPDKVRVLARFTGGKGTLDGSPWSPDGKSLAFVSYQLVPE